MSDFVDLYDNLYSNFQADALRAVRRETYGEDIGQNSWLTADELRTFAGWLEVGPQSSVLEVACGSGGPALFLAHETGCRVIGTDINEHGIATAKEMARQAGADTQVSFRQVDGTQRLPFDDNTFDALICIDAMNHLPDRVAVLKDWHRVLKPGGLALFTDPVVITGPVSNEELAIRSSIYFFLFVPLGYNASAIEQAGFTLVRQEDASRNAVDVSRRRRDARQKYRKDLLGIEGEERFEGLQRFLAMVTTLTGERRLSRVVYLLRK